MCSAYIVVYVPNWEIYWPVFIISGANRHCCLIAAQYNGYKHRSMRRWIFCYHILDNTDISRGAAVSEGTNRLSPSPVTRHHILEVMDSIKILVVWRVIEFTRKVWIWDHVLYKDSGVFEINIIFIIHPLRLWAWITGAWSFIVYYKRLPWHTPN